MKNYAFLPIVFSIALLSSVPLLAQENKSRTIGRSEEELREDQRDVRRQINQLLEKMFAIADRISTEDREAAERLKKAKVAADKMEIVEKMKLLEQLIKEGKEGRFGHQSGSVIRNIENVLDILEERRRQNRLDDLVDIARDIDRYRKIQNEIRDHTGKFENKKEQSSKVDGKEARKFSENKNRKPGEKGKKDRNELSEKERRRWERLRERQEDLKEKLNETRRKADRSNQSGAAAAIGRARKKMGEAAKQMKNNNSSSGRSGGRATASQKEAEEELDRAYRKIQEAIRNQRQKQNRESLLQLRRLLEEMKSGQKAVHRKTSQIHELRKNDATLSRKNTSRIRSLGTKTQQDLVDQANRILKKLKDENAVVYSWMMKTIRDDMHEIKSRLFPKKKTGPFTQRLQKNVVQKIQELIDALKRQLRNRKRSTGGGGGG